VEGTRWVRYPVKTHFIGVTDRLEDIIEKWRLKFVSVPSTINIKSNEWYFINFKI